MRGCVARVRGCVHERNRPVETDDSHANATLAFWNGKLTMMRVRYKLYQSVGSRIGDHARAHRQSQDRWEILGRREPVATRRNGIEPVVPTAPDQ